MTPRIAIIGAGPAGLFAAQCLAEHGLAVHVFDQRPSPARKFLMAGLGGLNLTHSEEIESFLGRYRPQEPKLLDAVTDFPPSALRAWSERLGHPTFIGSSGKVFPESFKASPLLRNWLRHLEALGVQLEMRVRWQGLDADGAVLLQREGEEAAACAFDAVLLALGGGSWAKLGSDGHWVPFLRERGVCVSDLKPSNCGFKIGFSEFFQEKFKGTPLKKIAITHGEQRVLGDAMVDAAGLEGGAIYALSAGLREDIALNGSATLSLDLKPDVSKDDLVQRLRKPRGKQSVGNYLRKACGLPAVAAALLREVGDLPNMPETLAERIKGLRLTALAPRPIDRAISSAGGVVFNEINDTFMLTKLPGVFVAGEMLDWEAPTGGYLLQGVFATGRKAALGIIAFVDEKKIKGTE